MLKNQDEYSIAPTYTALNDESVGSLAVARVLFANARRHRVQLEPSRPIKKSAAQLPPRPLPFRCSCWRYRIGSHRNLLFGPVRARSAPRWLDVSLSLVGTYLDDRVPRGPSDYTLSPVWARESASFALCQRDDIRAADLCRCLTEWGLMIPGGGAHRQAPRYRAMKQSTPDPRMPHVPRPSALRHAKWYSSHIGSKTRT